MCFASVLQPRRWQVLKANMKEGELLEGSKEFLLPDPRVCAVFWGMLLSQCALWNCPVFCELNRRLLGTASLFLALGLRMSAAKNVCWQTCVFMYYMAQLCLSWGFLSAVGMVRHLCLLTLDWHSKSDRNLQQRADLWTSAPEWAGCGELWEQSRAEPLFCPVILRHKLCCFSGIHFSYCWLITFWARSFMPTSFKILRNYSVFGKHSGLHTKLTFLSFLKLSK